MLLGLLVLSPAFAGKAWIAARDLPPGHVLAEGDLVRAKAVGAVDGPVADGAVGRTTNRAIPAGAYVRTAWLGASALEPSVVDAAQVRPLAAPNGKAWVVPLVRGQHAFVAELRMEPGAAVPEHRDPTEETIVVLEGTGDLTLNGEVHALGPGSAVLMPAGATVSYQNGPRPMRAIQVFASPEPSAKYGGWEPGRSARSDATRVGSLVVGCDDAECRVRWGGRTVADELEWNGAAADVLTDLGAWMPERYLVAENQGDGCPVMYRLLCPEVGTLTEPFGNCEEPVVFEPGLDGGLTVGFESEVDTRPDVRVHLDPGACTADSR